MIPQNTSGFLFDLDGVFTIGNNVVPGAVKVIQKLNKEQIPFRFLTNTTMKSVSSLTNKLKLLGFDVTENHFISANFAGVLKLREMGNPSCFLALLPDAQIDYDEFNQSENPDVVVIGDLGKSWTFEFMNKLFRMIMESAEILALHKGKYYQVEHGLQMDTGAIIAGLEYATGKKATVVGKPEKEFFSLALKYLKMNKDEVVMIGDDLENDVGGAQQCGIKAGLVKTGKFRQDVFESSDVKPDFVLESIGELFLSQ